jgi:hypothetical protein
MVLACAVMFTVGDAASTAASAAMRYCIATVVGEGVGESEIDAKREAMGAWKTQSVAAGVAHPSWRIALERSLACRASGDGGFICKAIAAPCTISQVPLDERP